MKSCLRSFLLSLLILPGAIHASTTAPMFAGSPGTTLTIQGENFNWASATEDGTWHNDTYTNTSQTVTVTGKIGSPNLATVSGSTSTGTVDGYLQNGVYGDNHQVSSSQTGWVIEGVSYTNVNWDVTYQVDFTAGVLRTIHSIADYTGPNASLHINSDWDSGNDFQESQTTFTGRRAPYSGLSSLQAFGCPYAYVSSTSNVGDYYDDTDYAWTDTFINSSTGSTISIAGGSSSDTVPNFTVTFWHPNVGTLTSNTVVGTYSSPTYFAPDANLSGVTWRARSAPSLARPQLWLDEKLLNWQSGTVTAEGLFTDTYSGAGLTLTVSAKFSEYFAAGSTTAANVTITSGATGSGTMGHDKMFAMVGHVLQNAEPNHSAPLFTGSVTVLRVTFSNYAFTGGFEDSLGNRTDVYVNSSQGTLTISGTTSDPNSGAVRLSRSSSFYSGTYSNGFFSVSGTTVTKPTSQPSIYGPPAFWVRGELYLRIGTTANYTSTSTHSLTLTGTGSWTLAGTDGTGSFSGACSTDPVGVFLVQALDGAGQPVSGVMVPVVPANADGTLQLSWSGAPNGMPPAVQVNTHALVYLGTAADDTNPAATAAYYGSDVMSDQTPWLLKLRTDGSDTTSYTATYTDYSTATSTTGSYTSQTHLFQTSALGTGFPVPVYGVDPNANFALWGLSQPDSATSLPATFLVQGDIWRYTGTNSSGAAIYQGYYSSPQTGSQIMTVAVPDADGARVVTVTDPYYGDGTPTTGTLNDVRGSARLRDGSDVYSGNFSGQQVNPTLNPNNLHTIAADLDVTGNVITFGALTANAATAGVTLMFQDKAVAGSLTASLYSMLARPQAQWVWARTASSSGQSTLQVMQLDATHKLTLYDPAGSGQAGVVLDPKPDGVSTLKGVLRVRPGGDIDMGEFQAGGQP